MLSGNGVVCCVGDGQECVLLFVSGSDLGVNVKVQGVFSAEGCFSCVMISVLFKKCVLCV